jgi:uncharacterized protein (UPF0147 family)
MENNKVGVPQSVEAPTLDEIMMAFVRIGRDGSVPVDVRNFATEWRDKIENLAEARPVEAPTVRDALKECYVDLAAVLYATTYELAPGVRAQLEKTRKLAEDALAGVGPVEAPLNKWISVEERLPEKAGEYLVVEDGDEEASTADFFCALEHIRKPKWQTVRSFGQDCEGRELYNVTYWQVLPAPPGAEPLPAPANLPTPEQLWPQFKNQFPCNYSPGQFRDIMNFARCFGGSIWDQLAAEIHMNERQIEQLEARLAEPLPAVSPTHSFEDTVQPALNALSLESLKDMQVKIAERINELAGAVSPEPQEKK